MKVKTSKVIGETVRAWLTARGHRKRDVRELKTINQQSRRLNREAVDVLEYQARPER